MRPVIVKDDIADTAKLSKQVFEYIAKAVHYKALFTIQKNSQKNLHQAIIELLKNDDFANECVKVCNSDKHYSESMNILISNLSDFDLESIPVKDCDFKVMKNNNSCTYFYIEERIGINYYDGEYQIVSIVVDDKNNKLYFTYNDGDPLDHYSETGEVGLAYKSWLAEKELLK
jgi:hypothetical protein